MTTKKEKNQNLVRFPFIARVERFDIHQTNLIKAPETYMDSVPSVCMLISRDQAASEEHTKGFNGSVKLLAGPIIPMCIGNRSILIGDLHAEAGDGREDQHI